MTYRVSTGRSGRKLWWRQGDIIPADHTAVRPATAEESELMDRVLSSRLAPSSWLERLRALMEQTP